MTSLFQGVFGEFLAGFGCRYGQQRDADAARILADVRHRRRSTRSEQRCRAAGHRVPAPLPPAASVAAAAS